VYGEYHTSKNADFIFIVEKKSWVPFLWIFVAQCWHEAAAIQVKEHMEKLNVS